MWSNSESKRLLRSKNQRNALYLAADGICVSCGVDLPSNWHADHIDPWSKTKRTNVHEMQALCPNCNRRKGVLKMEEFVMANNNGFKLRTHQQEMQKIARRLATGDDGITTIISHVTPGGGKSLLPIIAMQELKRANKIDKACIVVPRKSLQDQMERGFIDNDVRRGLSHSLSIMQATNEINPSKGTDGYVTTYQAIAQDRSGINQHELNRSKYLLVLDEPHHLLEGDTWHHSLIGMIERAEFVMLMSGTLYRHDRQKIAFLSYRGTPPEIDCEAEGVTWIKYSRRDALREKAIIRPHFQLYNGNASWLDREGKKVSIDSLNETNDHTALNVALEAPYAFDILDQGWEDWVPYKKQVYSGSKLLLVAPNIEVAKQYQSHLAGRQYDCGIATSEDGSQALNEIKRFRHGDLDCLVTVGMAYEGLDVPQITHLIILTPIRSRPWIEQVIARATRYNRHGGRWEEQTATIYVPDDPQMQEIIDKIEREQVEVLARELDEDRDHGGNGSDTVFLPWDYIPLNAAVTQERSYELDGQGLDHEETSRIRHAMTSSGIAGISPIKLKEFLGCLGMGKLDQDTNVDSPPSYEPIPSDEPMTPSEKRHILRKKINKRCSAIDNKMGWEHGDMNRKVVRHFGKSRQQMSNKELKKVWGYLNQKWEALQQELDKQAS